MSYNAVLTDKKDEQVLPITTAENVFYSGSKTVKQVIDEIIAGGGGGGGSSIIFGTVEPSDEIADCYVKYTDSSAESGLIPKLHGSTAYTEGNVAEYDSENDIFILHSNDSGRPYNYSMASIQIDFDNVDSIQIHGNCINYAQAVEAWCMALGVGDYNSIDAHDTTDYELGVKACKYVFPNDLPVGEDFEFNLDVSDVSGTHYFNIIVQRSVEINLTLLTKDGEMPQDLQIDDIYFRINDTWVKYGNSPRTSLIDTPITTEGSTGIDISQYDYLEIVSGILASGAYQTFTNIVSVATLTRGYECICGGAHPNDTHYGVWVNLLATNNILIIDKLKSYGWSEAATIYDICGISGIGI